MSTRLQRLYNLRTRLDEEIAAEEAREARIHQMSRRLPSLPVDQPDVLLDLVAHDFGVSPDALTGRGRSSEVADARAVVTWLADREGITRRATADLLCVRTTFAVNRWLDRIDERPGLLARAQRLAERLDGGAAA